VQEQTKRDFYEVLGVARDASPEEIKKAYRTKAMEFHPDRNPGDREAEEAFKEAAEAYEALGDPNKRQLYDTYGFAGLKGTDFRSYSSFEDIFSSFGDIFGDLFGFGRTRQAWHRGADARYMMELTFEEAARGVSKSVDINRPKVCPECRGSRSEPGKDPETCTRCGGRGQVLRNHGFLHISTSCPSCDGEGKIISHPCRTCDGQGQVVEKHSVDVDIPAGVEENSVLRVRGEGMPSPSGGPPGDLLIGIHVAEHELFQRRGPDLFMVLPLSFVQAALGDRIEIPTLDEPKEMKVPAGTQPGAVLTIEGGGIRIGGTRGDLHAQVDVKIPTKLNAEQKELLRQYAATEGMHPKERKWWNF
jgi:molecular chaperone DnaJ